MKRIAIGCGLLSAVMLIGLACLLGAYPGNVGNAGGNALNQTSPLATNANYTATGSGYFAFTSAGPTNAYYLSSGNTATATSAPCNGLLLQLAGTGVLNTSGGTNGFAFATSGGSATGGSLGITNSACLTLTPPCSNLNALRITGTGSVGYIYTN